MKHRSLTLASLILLAPFAGLRAQDAAAAPSGAVEVVPGASAGEPWIDEGQDTLAAEELLKKLKPEEIAKVKRSINEASNFVSGIRLQEALQRLDEAEALAPELFMIHNLKGAVFVKMRAFDKAREAFQRAAELSPRSFQPRFNLAELDFVQAASKVRKKEDGADWEKARQSLESLLRPGMRPETRKLIVFKIIITLAAEGKYQEAEQRLSEFTYLDDQPIYHMSHAAIEFAKGSKEEAQSWIDSANRIYPTAEMVTYLDSFIEMGWVESLAI